jgi:hypothetical protein
MGGVNRFGRAPFAAAILGLAGGGALIVAPWISGDHGGAPQGLCFSTPMAFEKHMVSGCLTHSDIEMLASDPLSLGENAGVQGVTLTDPHNVNAQRLVSNCKAYDAASRAGWYALTTYDQSIESYFKRACGVLALMANGARAERSFLGPAEQGFGNADRISASAIASLIPEGRGLTIGDLVRGGSVTILAEQPRRIVLTANGMEAELTEIARGDFDGDGIADMLAFLAVHAQNGTFRSYDVLVLTRKALNRPLDVSRTLASGKP